MPRKIDIVVPAATTENLLHEIGQIKGIVGLRVQRGISVRPPGDVVSVELTNHDKPHLLQMLAARGIGSTPDTAFTTSESASTVSAEHAGVIVRDTSEASWEEMEQAMSRESTMDLNASLVMFIAGVLATVDIATNALHIVVGAMLIAPGFQPIVRTALGAVARSASWKRGLLDVARGYALLIVGAATTTLLLQQMGIAVLTGEGSYLPAGTLISYWMSLKPTALIVTAVAAIAGAVLIADDRSLLTSGVMVGLALVPAATIIDIGLAITDWQLLWLGLRRWLLEATLVVTAALLVFLWKRWRLHRRDMLL